MRTPTPATTLRDQEAGQIGAEAALAIAEDFLLMKVGDLLGAENPRRTADGRWLMSITLGNAAQGTLGDVGTIAVDTTSGEVIFSDEEREQVEERARTLSGSSPP